MMTPPTLLFASSSLIILLLHFFPICHANCTPSACGIIRNISYPFRLEHDPKHCGDREYELACENNVASLYLDSHKYYVKEINYLNSTIRLVDASLNNDTCSFPNYSEYHYPYNTLNSSSYPYHEVAWPLYFMSCPHPLKNSSLFTDITHCQTSNSNSSHPTRFTYIKVGRMNASEVPETCRVELIVMTSWRFKDLNNVSLSEIHHSLLYGFEFYTDVNSLPAWAKWLEFFIGRYDRSLVILLVIVVLLSAGVGPPMMIIIVFTGGLGFLTYFSVYIIRTSASLLSLAIGVSCAPRFIMYLSVGWFLIYKFRRRHLSSYDAIECFLQSDNKLMPIRYSYSDIKKMTKGFQDKLGEGGYGSVYKGKLRSGRDVAVKLLGKSGGSGQDFMNEIATIGRIHHVNIVTLVGYCAQGSKRALVFDLMLNGSLEKYIFNREKMNSLNWDIKFDIVVGVARGIEYLHGGCDVQILHFDIKPHNILLDDKFVPKISDFGLAKFCSAEKNTITMTTARGTIGYVAPELINRSLGRVSYKADVYSFGMLLMEMVGLKRDLMGNNDGSSMYFPYWIYDCFNQGKDIEIGKVDENDNNTRKLARKMTIVALWCIQMSPDDRPSMNKVLEMLEGDVECLQLPEYPSQSTQIVINVDQTGITCSTDSVSLLHHDDASPYVEITSQK